jgi:hypothetical protein
MSPHRLLVDRLGTMRWLFRPDRHIVRQSPSQLLAAVDEHMPSRR